MHMGDKFREKDTIDLLRQFPARPRLQLRLPLNQIESGIYYHAKIDVHTKKLQRLQNPIKMLRSLSTTL
jgi:hypothetical protein